MSSSSNRRYPVVLVLVLCVVFSGTSVPPAWAATATKIAAATDAACALTDTGAVHCWGGSFSPSTGSFIPEDVAGLGGVVTALDAGQGHWCVVTSVGGAKCWGWNDEGQLGDGTNTSRSAPADVVGLTSGVLAIGAGWSHACAVTTGGALHCWGQNENGQLGDGTQDDSSVPIDVVGLSSGIAAVAGSFGTTCAVTTSGGVKCWGIFGSGRQLTPVDVAGITDAAAIAVGIDYLCFLTTSGAVRCLGSNDVGQLGDGTNDPSSSPVDVIGLGSGVVAIDALSGHTCALTGAGAVKCWGRNDDGQLGDGSATNRSTPVTAAGLGAGGVAIAAGENESCAVLGNGAVECWGGGAFRGALGSGFWFDETRKPVHVVDFGPPICALLSPGQRFESSPAARLLRSGGRSQDNLFDDTMSVTADFSLPATVSFSMLHPLAEGARLQLRTAAGTERVDATVPAGAYDPAAKRGWKTAPTGTSTTFLDLAPIAPYGIRRLQIIDRSKGALGGTVRVKLTAKRGLYRVSPGDEPVEFTIVLGDDVAAGAGKCGVSNWGPGDCSFNQPGTTLKCGR